MGERQWNSALSFLTWQHLGHCQRNWEVRTIVRLQARVSRGEGKTREVLQCCKWCLCKHLSLMWASWFLECLRPLCLPKLFRLCLTHPAQQNLTHPWALVQHPAAGTISLLQWVQLCSFVLVWRFLFQHWGFKAGVLILAVTLTEFNQRALHKSFITRTWWLLSLSHYVRGASKALIQSKDFRAQTLKPVMPNWLPQLLRCFCCDLRVPTDTGAVQGWAPPKAQQCQSSVSHREQCKSLLKTTLAESVLLHSSFKAAVR